MKNTFTIVILLFLSTGLLSLSPQEKYIEQLKNYKELTFVNEKENIIILRNTEKETFFLIFTADFHKEAGYNGITNTALLLNERLEIIEMEIVSSDDTPSYIRKLRRNRFLKQFMGNPDFNYIEAVTGATISSKAVINSIRISLIKVEDKLQEFSVDTNP